MPLVIIFGPPAVGKTLELVNNFYDFGTPDFRRLDKEIRFSIFRSVAASDLEGLIFTFVWAVEEQSDVDYVKSIVEIFETNDGEVFYVELRTDLSERLKRNKGADRIAAKPSKRNIEFSEKNLLASEKYKLNTDEGDLKELEILKIDNTHLNAADVAIQIKNHFKI